MEGRRGTITGRDRTRADTTGALANYRVPEDLQREPSRMQDRSADTGTRLSQMKRPVKLTRQILWSFLKRTAAVIVTVLVVFAAYLILRSYSSPPRGPVGVKVPPDENLRIAQISDNGVH